MDAATATIRTDTVTIDAEIAVIMDTATGIGPTASIPAVGSFRMVATTAIVDRSGTGTISR